MLSRFEVVHRTRPLALVLRGTELERPVSPYLAVEALVTGPGRVELALASGDVTLLGVYDDRGLHLEVTVGGTTTTHRSRRHGRPGGAVEGVALTLTGPHLVVLSHEGGEWRARGRVDLTDRVDIHDEAWLARVEPSATGPVAEVRSGRFGQVGLRDLRLVTHADGTAYRDGRSEVLLTATSAGPGHFATGHTSVWRFDPDSFELTHSGRPVLPPATTPACTATTRATSSATATRGVVATSTWGDFDRQPSRRDGRGDARRDRRRPHHRCPRARHPPARAADDRAALGRASGTPTWSAPPTAGWSATSARPSSSASTPCSPRGPTSTR